MAGIADVARLAAVSKATASRALTGNGYVAAATRGRACARRPTSSATRHPPTRSASPPAAPRTSASIMPYANRWFFAEVLEGIQGALLEHGLDLTLYDAKPGTAGRARIFGDFLARKRFDGLIAVGLEPEDGELEMLRRVGRPARERRRAPRRDERRGDRRRPHRPARDGAPDHARATGASHSSAGPAGEHGRERRPAAAARATGRRWRMPGSTSVPACALGGQPARAATRPRSTCSATPGDGPPAIVAVCDEVAIGAIIAARRLGIQVPSDLSVVGIDDHEYAEMFSLTTLRQVPREQGAAAVGMLLAQLAGSPPPPAEVLLTARLIVRSSTGPVDPQASAVTAGTRLRTGG